MINFDINDTKHHRRELIDAYAALAQRYVDEGWTPYLLTFMYRPIGGSPATVAQRMQDEVERVYATYVTRVVRKPTSVGALGRLPVWLGGPDLPVFKHAKRSISDVTVNGGRHMHALALDPPWSRLREEMAEHVEQHRRLYVRPDHPLVRLDVQPIEDAVGYVTGYALRRLIPTSL